MSTTTDLTSLAHATADLLTDDVWMRGSMHSDDGTRHCLHGGVLAVCQSRPEWSAADGEILRAVLRHKGLTEEWNDRDAAGASEVRAALIDLHVTDSDLAETFGPLASVIGPPAPRRQDRSNIMNVPTDLTGLAHATADLLADDVWMRGAMHSDDGTRHCLHGGVLAVCQSRPEWSVGDGEILRAVLRHKGLDEEWNDEDAANASEVRAALIDLHVTDSDLAETFGPQWQQIVALVRRVAALTPEEAERLRAAWAAVQAAAGVAAVQAAAWAAAVRVAVQAAAWAAAWDAAGAAAGEATRAALALAIRHLIGHGFTQEHYDLLTQPLASVIGPLHPDDKIGATA